MALLFDSGRADARHFTLPLYWKRGVGARS